MTSLLAPGPSTPIPLTRPSTDEAELAAVAEVMASGWLAGQGPRSTALEQGFAELTGRSHAVALNNCTAGLHLALAGLGVGPGDEVLVADYSFPATGHAVLYCGATPVFVDVRADTGTMDPDLVEAAITPRPGASSSSTRSACRRTGTGSRRSPAERGLFLVEDAACAAGGEYDGRPCGSFGDVAVFSLHARKGITCGEGGVLVTDDAESGRPGAQRLLLRDAERVRPAVRPGLWRCRRSPTSATTTSCPTCSPPWRSVQLDQARRTSRRGAEPSPTGTPSCSPTCPASAHRVVPTTGGRPGRRTPSPSTNRSTATRSSLALRARGIGTTIGTYAMHLQPVYGAPADCPVSERLFRRHLALPMFPDLTDADQDRVVATLPTWSG